jgi:nitroimidazol reductase NimA-like FMN-containing flavoprotein (pyridoxamine 5'-phosphate oxidase superfamily)
MTEARLEELSYEECLSLLRTHELGRIAVVVDDVPIVVPVNYTFVEASGRTWIAFRTREGSIMEQGSIIVAFQIDGADEVRREGWSVLAIGTLHRVNPDAADFRERFDPRPWVEVDRDAWLIVDPIQISGRRIYAEQLPHAFHARAYH